jgi:predicted DsbA family dithiol-disulfide isomerase
MKIEVWSDFVCPFCYLGKRKLELALEKFEHTDEVEIIFKSFELQMGNQNTKGKNIHQVVADKYHIPYEDAKANNDRITEAAAEVGLHYDFDHMKLNSTTLAHQIVHYAKKQDKDYGLILAYFKGYFEEGMDIGDEASLFELAEKAGLDIADLKKELESGVLLSEVRKDEEEAVKLGINSVPHFIIDGRYTVSGAQSPAYFLNALRTAYAGK